MQKLLSEAINYASTVVCENYEIDDVTYSVDGTMKLDSGADIEWTFADQQIDIDSDGEAVVADTDGNECTLIFKVCIPIRAVDFPK